MEFSFSQVEHTLACAQNVAPERRSAFANRIKNYQKAKFPKGLNTGRGQAATYGLEHLLQLGLAFELNQLGLNPERAAAVIESDMPAVAKAFFAAAGEYPRGEFVLPSFLYFDPSGLSDLMIPPEKDRAIKSFHHANLAKLKTDLDKYGKGGISRLSIVNVSALVWDLANYSPRKPTKHSDGIYEFYRAVQDWASPYINRGSKP